jgi:hypothetical protein
MYANMYDTASRMWVRIDSEGEAHLTPHRSDASVIESAQLASYIRNYELEYLANSLMAEPINDGAEDLPAHRVVVERS